MSTLTPSEAAILTQLREKPMRFDHIPPERRWSSVASLVLLSLVHVVEYVQLWRTQNKMTICHLTQEGRMALIKHEECAL